MSPTTGNISHWGYQENSHLGANSCKMKCEKMVCVVTKATMMCELDVPFNESLYWLWPHLMTFTCTKQEESLLCPVTAIVVNVFFPCKTSTILLCFDEKAVAWSVCMMPTENMYTKAILAHFVQKVQIHCVCFWHWWILFWCWTKWVFLHYAFNCVLGARAPRNSQMMCAQLRQI